MIKRLPSTRSPIGGNSSRSTVTVGRGTVDDVVVVGSGDADLLSASGSTPTPGTVPTEAGGAAPSTSPQAARASAKSRIP
jgi:hypothetical protein